MPRRYYILWLIAMACTEIGSTLDVSWHFGHVFDEISPPHLTSFAGVCLMVGLLYWALVRERERVVGLERTALRVSAVALGIGILDMPLDFLWHQLFGIDITTWSPTHLMLNFPSDVYNVAVITALLASPAVRGLGAWAIAFAVCFRNILTTHFALNQQEYGAVVLASLQRTGHIPWYVEPPLLKLVGPSAAQLVTGGIPDWLYLIYVAFALGYALTFGATVLGGRSIASTRSHSDVWPLPIFGAGTALALTFVAWRLGFRMLFLAVHQAYPVVAWYIVPMGVVVDLSLMFGPRVVGYLLANRVAVLRPYREVIAAALSGVVAAIALYGGITLMSATQQIVPATPLAALPFACLTGAFGTALGYTIAASVRENVYRSPAAEGGVPVHELAAHHTSKDVVEPGKEAINFPGVPIASEQTASRVFALMRLRR